METGVLVSKLFMHLSMCCRSIVNTCDVKRGGREGQNLNDINDVGKSSLEVVPYNLFDVCCLRPQKTPCCWGELGDLKTESMGNLTCGIVKSPMFAQPLRGGGGGAKN